MKKGLAAFGAFLWGLFCFDFYKEVVAERERQNRALSVLLFGEFVGLPIMAAPVTLRLLPYLVKDLGPWKRATLTEKEVIEEAPHVH